MHACARCTCSFLCFGLRIDIHRTDPEKPDVVLILAPMWTESNGKYSVGLFLQPAWLFVFWSWLRSWTDVAPMCGTHPKRNRYYYTSTRRACRLSWTPAPLAQRCPLCVRARVCACTHLCLHACVWSCVPACVHVRACVRVRACACVRACVCACGRVCLHACVHVRGVRACMHACVQPRLRVPVVCPLRSSAPPRMHMHAAFARLYSALSQICGHKRVYLYRHGTARHSTARHSVVGQAHRCWPGPSLLARPIVAGQAH